MKEWRLILRMQTLGLSDSTTRTESRLKSLLWPSIQSGADVDYLAVQGYWVCTVVAAMSFAFLVVGHQPIIGVAIFLFFHFGGIGVREHNRFAATIVFVFYAIDMLISLSSLVASPAITVLRVIITALLASNLRGTWIAARWRLDSEEAALPPRFGDTWTDKFADKWPAWIWPKARVVYYIFSGGFLLLTILGLAEIAFRRSN
jgi:hypothetical protein